MLRLTPIHTKIRRVFTLLPHSHKHGRASLQPGSESPLTSHHLMHIALRDSPPLTLARCVVYRCSALPVCAPTFRSHSTAHAHTYTFTIAHTHWLTSHREKVNQSLLYNDELRRRRRTAGMARFFRGLLCHFRRTAVVNLMHVALAAHSGTRRALTRHSEHRFAGLKLPISIATAAAGPHPLAHEGCCVKSETVLPNVHVCVCALAVKTHHHHRRLRFCFLSP